MRRLICWLKGHNLTRVREVGLTARPGGMLAFLDGWVTHAEDAEGEFFACRRCRKVPIATEEDDR